MACSTWRGREPALGGRPFVILADDRNAPVERFLFPLENRDGIARSQEVHRNAAAHRASAEDTDLPDGQDRRVRGNVVDFRRSPFGEEDMPQRSRLGPRNQAEEEIPFLPDALFIGQIDRRLDRLDTRLRRLEPLQAPHMGRSEFVEECAVRCDLPDPVRAPRRHRVTVTAHDRPREGDTGCFQPVFGDQLVDETDPLGPGGGNRGAGHDHRQGLGHADDTGQTLRTARTGKKTQLDLRQAQPRRAHGYAVVTAQRDLQPSAQGGAVNGGDDRLLAGLDRVDHLGEGGPDRRLAEFGDVGTGEEGAPLAADHHGLDAVIAGSLGHRIGQSRAHRLAECVDRRIV